MTRSTLSRELARGIEWDCAQLLYRFYYLFDQFRYDDMVGLFLSDGTWHRAGKALKGREAILAALHERSATQRVRHVITNVLVDAVDETTAEAVLYVTAYHHDSGVEDGPPPRIKSPYLLLVATATLVKTGETWRIAVQTMKREFEFAP